MTERTRKNKNTNSLNFETPTENSQTWTDFMRKVLTVYTEQTDERFKKQQLDNQRLSVELTELKKVHLDLPYLKNMFINYVTHAEDREV